MTKAEQKYWSACKKLDEAIKNNDFCYKCAIEYMEISKLKLETQIARLDWLGG